MADEDTGFTLELQVQLVELVERNDLGGLARQHRTHGVNLWNTLCTGQLEPRYPNSGTLVHWAIWCQHYDVVTMAVAAGANLASRGVGSWMEGLCASEYAELLDEKAKHQYYGHAKALTKALCGGDQGSAAMQTAVRCMAVAELELAPFDDAARIEDQAVTVRLHDMVEHHCLGGLELAVQRFGSQAIATALVEPAPEDSPFHNRGTLAHWAVWYQHWGLLHWLQTHGCFDTTVRGVGGGWLRDKTAADYADFLDEKCQHPFYAHRVEVAAALTNAVEPGANGPAGGVPAHGGAAASFGGTRERQAAQCCICIEAPASHLIRPCRHLCVCGPCGAQLQAHGGGGPCPICRAAIEAIDEVFMA
jgi:hypothetical protein